MMPVRIAMLSVKHILFALLLSSTPIWALEITVSPLEIVAGGSVNVTITPDSKGKPIYA